MASITHPTYTEVIVYDRQTRDEYGTLTQQRVHIPRDGDIISLGNIIADREPGDEDYQISEQDSQSYIVTGVEYDYNAVQYRVSGEPEDTQLIEQIWIAVEPVRTAESE